MPFHVVARLQNREPLFRGCEAAIVDLLLREVNCGARLLAYAVMPNHLHMIVSQGAAPLSTVMQPLLRRIALFVQRRHGREGHVFERRFRAHACLDPDYLRNAIAYVHLNPVRAELCSRLRDSAWTSHQIYRSRVPPGEGTSEAAMAACVELFACAPGRSRVQWRADYMSFLRWRQAVNRLAAEDMLATSRGLALTPVSSGGDVYWQRHHATILEPDNRIPARRDLRDIARDFAAEQDPPIPLELLRTATRERAVVRVRGALIVKCVEAGYTTTQIASFLRVSPSAVSRVAAPLRWPMRMSQRGAEKA